MAAPLLTLFGRRSSLSASTLGTIFTAGYWHTGYSSMFQLANGTVPADEGDDLVRRVSDLSSAGNYLVNSDVGLTQPSLYLAEHGPLYNWNVAPAFLSISNPLSFPGAFTLIYETDSHVETDVHFAFYTDGSNRVAHSGTLIDGKLDGNSFTVAADIPDLASKVVMAMWRTAGDALKFAATGLPTVEIGTIAGTVLLSQLGESAGLYETKKLIAAGAVGSDVSAQLPAIAVALGTTLAL